MNNYNRNLFSEGISQSAGSSRLPNAFGSTFRPTYEATYPPFSLVPRAPSFPQYRTTTEYSPVTLSGSAATVKFEPAEQE